MNNISRRKLLKLTGLTLGTIVIPNGLFSKYLNMNNRTNFDAVIIGGSNAGLSAALSLGRSLRNILIIDDGKPCNLKTPHSHNFLTNDGKTPGEITSAAIEQIKKYPTVTFLEGFAAKAVKTGTGFNVTTASGEEFNCRKLILATGIKDIMPQIAGFAECWGKSIIHCPYCHGYEARNGKTGILMNGEHAFELAKMVYNLTKDLTLFTNGHAEFSDVQITTLNKHGIRIVEKQVQEINHNNGEIRGLVFSDGTEDPLNALYARVQFKQSCNIPLDLGCEFTEHGYIKTDMFQNTGIKGLFACGDNSNMMRSIAHSVAAGNLASAMANREMAEEDFNV